MAKTFKGKVLALFLTLTLVFGIPFTAFAAADLQVSPSTHTFPQAELGYGPISAQTFTISHVASSSGTTADNITATWGTTDFDVSPIATSLATSATTTFTIAPRQGLAVGSYTDTITISNDSGSDITVTVSFDVASPSATNPPTNPGSTTSSSSSGGGGGGGGGGGVAAPQTSSNVNSDGSVNNTTVTNELKKALSSADSGDTAVVAVKNATSISASVIQALANAAKSAGKDAVIHADTVDSQGIQGRLYIDPANFTGLKGDLKLSVETRSARPITRKMQFQKYFSNHVSVVSFGQTGSFGTRIKLAAKVELPKDTSNLVFYSYNAETNKYKKFQTKYRIDRNGFIHFETELAGDIIISNGNLESL